MYISLVNSFSVFKCSAHVQNVFYQKKKHNYAYIEVVFNQQTKVTWSDMPAFNLLLFGRLGLGDKKKGALRTEGNTISFSMLSA